MTGTRHEGRKHRGRRKLAQTPQAGRIKAAHNHPSFGAQHPVDLTQYLMGILGELQDMRQHDQVDRLTLEGQLLEMTHTQQRAAIGRQGVVCEQHAHPIGDPIIAKRVDRRFAKLQGMKAEDIADRLVKLGLLPVEDIAPRRRFEPGLPVGAHATQVGARRLPRVAALGLATRMPAIEGCRRLIGRHGMAQARANQRQSVPRLRCHDTPLPCSCFNSATLSVFRHCAPDCENRQGDDSPGTRADR